MFFEQFSNLCTEKGVSRYKAAMDIGLNRSAVDRWRRGSVPTGSTLSKLAEYFGVTTDFLLGVEQGYSDTCVKFQLSPPDILTERVFGLCKGIGKTIESVEQELGFEKGTISSWRSSVPPVTAVAAIAIYFHVSLDYMVGITDVMESMQELECNPRYRSLFEAWRDLSEIEQRRLDTMLRLGYRLIPFDTSFSENMIAMLDKLGELSGKGESKNGKPQDNN